MRPICAGLFCKRAMPHCLQNRPDIVSGLFFTRALFMQGSLAKEPWQKSPAYWKSPDNLARLRIVSCMWHRAETNGQRSEWRVKGGTDFWRKQICLSEIWLSEYDCLSRPTQILLLVSWDPLEKRVLTRMQKLHFGRTPILSKCYF